MAYCYNTDTIKAAVISYSSRNQKRFQLAEDLKESQLRNAIKNIAPDVKPEHVIAVLDESVLGNGSKGFLLTSSAIYFSKQHWTKDFDSYVTKKIRFHGLVFLQKYENGIVALIPKEGFSHTVACGQYQEDIYQFFHKLMEIAGVTPEEPWKHKETVGKAAIAPTVAASPKEKFGAKAQSEHMEETLLATEPQEKGNIVLMPERGKVYKCSQIHQQDDKDKMFYIDQIYCHSGRYGTRKEANILFLGDRYGLSLLSTHSDPKVFKPGMEFEEIKGVYRACKYLGNARCVDESTGSYYSLEAEKNSYMEAFLARLAPNTPIKVFYYNGKSYFVRDLSL